MQSFIALLSYGMSYIFVVHFRINEGRKSSYAKWKQKQKSSLKIQEWAVCTKPLSVICFSFAF